MTAMSFEPFVRQVLIGGATGSATCRSEVREAVAWSSLAWWLDLLAGIPGTVTNPLTLFIETCDVPDGADEDWLQLIPGGENPNVGAPSTGSVTPTGRFVRFRVEIVAGEAVAFAVRAVGRGA